MASIRKPKLATADYDYSPCQLSDEQVDFYWKNGYLVVKKLYDARTLNLFKDRFIEICNAPASNRATITKLYSIVKDPSLYKKDANPETYINKVQELLYDPVYMRYSEDPNTLRILRQLIGDNITAVNCMLINKPPGTRDHPPHQDLLYFPFRPADKIVGVWTAVDRVHKNNGCLYVLPATHKQRILYNHCERATEKKQLYLGIEDEDAAALESQRVNLEMEPGDTVFLHPCLLHGSRANVSLEYRKAMTAHYANSSCYFIDVRGTTQEYVAKVIEQELKRRGGEINFVDFWKIKSKQVVGVRSHL